MGAAAITNSQTDPATDYATRVVAGEVVAGGLVRLACERHLRDLADGGDRGLYFDPHAAARVFRFFGFLRHTEGAFAGKRFALMPWQMFIVGSLFGWRHKRGGARRFRTAYVEVAKGNGKTPMAAGVGLYGLTADNEAGAQVFTAATTRDQAAIAYHDATNMAAASPEIAARISFSASGMAVVPTRSFFRPVSSEKRGLDGKRVHMAIIDELHEHASAIVVDKMRAGTKARRQALIFEITNSGYDRNTVCYAHHELSSRILSGIISNDSWFAFIAALDPCTACAAAGRTAPNDDCADCDDWRDERVWVKANPGLDTILPRAYLREQVAEAVAMPSKENIVRRLNFCQWTEQAVRWLAMTDWDACPKQTPGEEQLRRRICYGGLDLSTKVDLAAWALVFPPAPDDPNWVFVLRFFVPADNVRGRVERDHVPYDSWIRAGYITATPGNVCDYDVIENRIVADAKYFRGLQEVGFDPWNATHTANHLLAGGLKLIETRQGTATMSEPSKEFEAILRAKKINHGGNPVLRWNASNVSLKRDHNDNYMPDKERSTERIDGIVAALIAMARAIRNRPAEPSVYQTRGIFRL